jgi:hypothetical protein
MFRHIRVIIRELFRACCVTCESNAMVDKTVRYTLLCVCYVQAWLHITVRMHLAT